MSQLTIGVDVGGTWTKAAVVDPSGDRVGPVIRIATRPELGSARGLQTIAAAIRDAASAASIALDNVNAIGVATPGPVDLHAGVMLEPPNLKPWRDVPVRDFVAAEFGKPTAFQNDANAAALGEAWVGAGRGKRSFVLLTLGTGIGGGIVLDGQILNGAHSCGGEIGHTKIETTNGRLCPCGRHGCVEAYSGAPAIVARYREALGRARNEDLKLSVADVFDAANRGEETAIGVVDETALYLAVAIANVMHVIDPEVIALGGGVASAGEMLIERIRAAVRKLAFAGPAAGCEIRAAVLGETAGVIGAAGCAHGLLTTRMESSSLKNQPDFGGRHE